jgi:conjugative relaxase-like TrwC/TraI family protein
VGGVLSIAKLRVGAEAYQLTGVAQSLDDYYSGSGEAEGRWAGQGAQRLDLTGAVEGSDLRAVLAGIAPNTGGLSPNGEEIRPYARRVPGFDLTFKAPKSVSVLCAISDDPRVQGAIIDASETALRDTIGWLEREAMAVRRGSDDQRYLANLAAKDPALAEAKRLRKVQGGEMVAAVFRHRTSRAGDPLLHWHVLVPNMVRGDDGRWSAFVHPDLYRLAKAAGEVFQAALRHELGDTLGVRWRPGRHVLEVDGIPDRVCDAFSKRSAEIDAWLTVNGRGNDPASRQAAVLATRRGKAELEGERFDTAWKIEATRLGFGPEHVEQLIRDLHPHRDGNAGEVWRLPEVSVDRDGTPYSHDRVVTAEEWIVDLLDRDLVTGDATFTQAGVYQAVAHRLGDGATVATIDRIAARVLASPHVIPIASRDHRDGLRRWTSTAMVATERRLLDAFTARDTHTPIDPTVVAGVAANHPTLGADQHAVLATLAGSVDAVSVLIGPAGTGKTYTLGVVREAFEATGHTVIGATPSARAALELEVEAGIESVTLHALAWRWTRPGQGPDGSTVLVIDEAAMAATGDLEPVVSATIAAGGRVILAGDHHQLPEVGPGGALAAAAALARPVVELTINRRQLAEWERTALAALRAGSVPDAVAAYRDHGRVVVTDSHEDMIAAAVDRYFAAVDTGLKPVLMAGTNDTVTRLNWAVRQRLSDRTDLDLDNIVAVSGGRELVAGDRVVLRRNARITQPDGQIVKVRNSDVATVVDSAGDGGLTIRRDNDTAILTLDRDYVAGGWVDHGYAVTAHRAQGGTWDLAIAVGVDGLYREAAYVQLSRGRHANWLIIPDTQMVEIDAELARHDHGFPLPGDEPPEAFGDLIDRLQTSRAKMMALTRDPDADRVATLAADSTVPELEARAARTRTAERAATRHIGIDPDVVARAVERAQHTAVHLAVGQHVKAFDRHNVGVVVAFDDNHGTVDVHFVSHDGHHATRTLPWTELHIVDRHLPPARILPAHTQQILDDLVDACGQTLTAWHHHLTRNGIQTREGDRCDRAAGLLVDRTADRLTADPPVWLTDMIGARPDTPHQTRLWDHATHTIARHRLANSFGDDVAGIGPVPALDLDARHEWHNVSRQVLETRTQLDHVLSHEPEVWPRLRTLDELNVRLGELDGILAGAPADQRDLISRLSDTDQASLLDTTELLAAALETQGERRDWILEHWPHVIEHHQVRTAVDAGHHAPDLAALADQLGHARPGLALRTALDNHEPWLDRALCRLVPPHTTTINDTNHQLLERLADYRTAWGIEDDQPLGPAPRHAAQIHSYNTLFADLRDQIGHTGIPEPAVPITPDEPNITPHDRTIRPGPETLPQLELDF